MTQVKQSVSFLGNSRQPTKSLKGLQKYHRIPRSGESEVVRFLADRAKPDIEHDLDEMFKRLRDTFGYKRRDLLVTGPIDGAGAIRVPDFEYRLQIIPNAAEPEYFVWERSVVSISSLAIILNQSFQTTFDQFITSMIVEFPERLDIAAIIDHVEDLIDKTCSIDYDRDATWCEIAMIDSTAKMKIQPQQVSIKGSNTMGVRDLLGSYLHLQERFLETIDLPGGGLKVSPA